MDKENKINDHRVGIHSHHDAPASAISSSSHRLDYTNTNSDDDTEDEYLLLNSKRTFAKKQQQNDPSNKGKAAANATRSKKNSSCQSTHNDKINTTESADDNFIQVRIQKISFVQLFYSVLYIADPVFDPSFISLNSNLHQ